MVIISVVTFCLVTYILYKLLNLLAKFVVIPTCLILSIIGGLWVTTLIPQLF